MEGQDHVLLRALALIAERRPALWPRVIMFESINMSAEDLQAVDTMLKRAHYHQPLLVPQRVRENHLYVRLA